MSATSETAKRTSENPLPIISEDERAIQKLVSGYYDTFVVDPILAATYYGEPTLVVLPNQVVSLITKKDVEAFLAKGRDDLKARGYLNTRMCASRIKRLNATTVLYGTIAIRVRADGTELERAGFTYLVHKGDTGWKIHELIATDVESIIDA